MFSFSQSTPTWANDIACIFYSHCTTCHNPNGIAPFSLIDYADAYSHAGDALSFIMAKKMPPWPSDENYQKHAFANVLKQGEIDKVQAWVDAGAPSGNLAEAPVKPVYNSSSHLPTKNLSFTTPLCTLIYSSDDWLCFAFKSPIEVDTYIKSWEIISSNTKAVHHVEIYSDTSAISYTEDTLNSSPGYPGIIPSGSAAMSYKGVWFPGTSEYMYPDGMGTKLEKNSTITINVHFSPGRQDDTTRLQLNFDIDTVVNRVVQNDWVLGLPHIDKPLFIEADSIKTFYGNLEIKNDLTYISTMPHMHYLGKSFKTYVVTPSNDTIRLVDIDRWDFHWQMNYFFPKLIKIPANSFLKAEVTYDNTTGNPNNPNSPPIDVSMGFGSKDEMLVIYMGQTDYQVGDEDIIIDTSAHYNHSQYCIPTEISEHINLNRITGVYPNPAQNELVIDIAHNAEYFIYSIFGELLSYGRVSTNKIIDISFLANGVYFIKVDSQRGTSTFKFVKN